MANKHTTVLEFEVYGKRNIDALKDALNKAGIALELVETQATNTQREIHNLSAITKMATARLDNLSSSQKKALKSIVSTANLSGKANAPWIREREILQTERQVVEEKKLQRELRETERIRRRTERERIESRRVMMRRAGLSDGGGADLMGKSVSGPMRVIAYDLVRRSLTEIYALANKVSRSISEWIVDGIKFNDELARSQTFFTSLGILGFKGVTGGQMTIAEASVSKDPKVAGMYQKSVANSETVMRKLMAVSAMTGQDLGEIVSATRQSMTDLLNKINKDGKPGVYLQNVDTLNNVTERMVKLASVLRMADPQNRKLSFHMVGLQELFSGTTGTGEKGKKESAGLQNVKSLLMREGIKIGEERARQITQYVNKGNLEAAMDVVQDALERSGLGFEQLANMMNSTLQPAIDGTKMYLRIFNKIFTTDLYNRVLKPFFQATLRHFSLMEQDKVFVGAIEKLGRQFSDVTNDIIRDFANVIDYMTLIPDYSTKEGRAKYSINNKEVAGFFTTQTELQNVISTIGGGAKVMYAIFKVIAQFMMGLMGSRDGSQLADVAKQIETFGKAAKELGAQLRESFEWILKTIRTNNIDFFGVFSVKLTDFLKVLFVLIVAFKALKLAINIAGSIRELTTGVKNFWGETKEFFQSRREAKAAKAASRAAAAAEGVAQPGILSKIWTAVKTASEKLFGMIVSSFFAIYSIAAKVVSAIKNFFTSLYRTFGYLWNLLKERLPDMKEGIKEGISKIKKELGKKISQAFKAIGEMWSSFSRYVGPALQSRMGSIAEAISKGLVPVLRAVFGGILKVGLRAVPYVGTALLIIDLLNMLFPDIFDNIKEKIPEAMGAMFKGIEGIKFQGIEFSDSNPLSDIKEMLLGTRSVPTIPEPKSVIPKSPGSGLRVQQGPTTTIGQVIVQVKDAKDVGPAIDSIAPKKPSPTPAPSVPPDFKGRK